MLLNKPTNISHNLYSDNPVVSISCNFLQNEKEWNYSFNCNTKKYVYEKFVRIDYDAYRNSKEEIYFERDFENKKSSIVLIKN